MNYYTYHLPLSKVEGGHQQHNAYSDHCITACHIIRNYNFGPHALLLILVTIATCVVTEAVYEKIVHKKLTVKDYSAVVTGLLLALNLPPRPHGGLP